MANNCLATKLKGVVNNDNLFKLDEVRVKQTINQQTNLTFATTDYQKEFTVNILSEDGYFVDGNSKTYTCSTELDELKAIAAASYPCDLILSYVPKENVRIIAGVFYNKPKSIGYMTNVKILYIKGLVGVDMLDLNDLANISPDRLEAFELPHYGNSGVQVKNLSVLGNFKSLKSLVINGLTSPDEPITLESILDAWYAAGRISSSVTINSFGQAAITYNGAQLYGVKSFTFNASGWTENT